MCDLEILFCIMSILQKEKISCVRAGPSSVLLHQPGRSCLGVGSFKLTCVYNCSVSLCVFVKALQKQPATSKEALEFSTGGIELDQLQELNLCVRYFISVAYHSLHRTMLV
jgi:hypothetical protein